MRTLFIFLLAATFVASGQETPAPEYVKMSTNRGDIFIELYRDKAPKTVENFLSYVDEGYYEGVIFHRIVPGFVVQGGGFDAEFNKKATKEPVANEADNMLPNDRGTLSMARTSDPHSANAQFFINLVDNKALNHTGKTHSAAWGYAVFGKVVRGMDVVDAMATLPLGPGGPFRSSVPQVEAVIESAERLSALPVDPQAQPEGEAEDAAEEPTDTTEEAG